MRDRGAGGQEHGRRSAGSRLLGSARCCDASGALLIFDEVITGFRLARGGAQERFGVLPDLTILGKSSAADSSSRRLAAGPT